MKWFTFESKVKLSGFCAKYDTIELFVLQALKKLSHIVNMLNEISKIKSTNYKS